MAGMRATANQMLTKDATFLANDKKVKDIVVAEHWRVRDGAYLQENCNENLTRPTTETEKTIDQKLSDTIDGWLLGSDDEISLKKGAFINAVKQALENYQKDHNCVSRSLFHSQGSAFVARALKRLDDVDKNNTEAKLKIAKEIANSILATGVKKPIGDPIKITVKNHRIWHLLNALNESKNGDVRNFDIPPPEGNTVSLNVERKNSTTPEP